MTDDERCDNECCTICNTTIIRLTNINETRHTGPLLDPNTRHPEHEYYDD